MIPLQLSYYINTMDITEYLTETIKSETLFLLEYLLRTQDGILLRVVVVTLVPGFVLYFFVGKGLVLEI